MMSRVFIGLFFLCYLQNALAQPFGNEWINFNQRYFKIKLAENGVYRINATELELAGVPISTIAASRIKIFRRGTEIAVNKSSTGGFLDYLEFYGEKNDGKSDSLLYRSPSDQPHQYYNLFSDTASYFLTWNQTETGKSISTSTLGDNSGLTAEPYHLNELIQLQTNAYSPGTKFGFNGELSSGEYTEGEGWTGSFFTKNQSQTYNFNLGYFDNTGPVPKIQIGLIGGNSLTHNVRISAGASDLSLRTIDTVTFQGWTQEMVNKQLLWSDVALDGSLTLRITALGTTGTADRISVPFIKVVYPEEFDIGSANEKTYFQRTSTEARSYIIVPTSNAAGTRILEITDPIHPRFIVKTNFSDRFEFVVPDPTIARKLLAFTGTKSISSIREVNMDQIDPTNSNYLIISHPLFHEAASDGMDPLLAYKTYRESIQGGSYQVILATIDEIFNQFGYGDPTPLAIRNFVGHALTVGSPQHLFIIGKGLSANYGFYRQDPLTTTQDNFIPTFGYPGSDVLYSVKALGSGLDPAVGTGRLNAHTPEDVKSYLDKVKEMEILPFNQLWRKNLILMSGGQNNIEQAGFLNYVEDFKRIAEGDFLGGYARIRKKITTAPTEPIDIRTEINNGVGMVTIFGHSSSQNSDIEIGNVEDHNNTGKYPLFLANGCNAGEIFSTASSFSEPWVNAPGKGAMAFIAHADFSYSSNLKRFSDLFYQEAFAKEADFGRSLGSILTSLAATYHDVYGTDQASLAQVNLMSLLGDPAIKVFEANKPDFEADPNQTFAEALSGNQILASQNGFTINLVIKNYGKTTLDSTTIEIRRLLPDGEILKQIERIPSVKYQDTVQLFIENDPAKRVDGNNIFTFIIDPDNVINELNESNNQSTFELFIINGNTINLYPINYGVQSDKTVDFVFQPSSHQSSSRGYSLEYDTVSNFSSTFKTSLTVNGTNLIRHPTDFTTLPDSTTIYWRTRFADPGANEDTIWVNSSFSLIDAIVSGWGQVDAAQFSSNVISGVTINENTGLLDFTEDENDYEVATHGKDHPNQYEDYQVVVGNVNYMITENPYDPLCKVNSINAVFIDRATGQPYRPINFQIGDINNPLICGRVPQVIHNLSVNDVLGSNRYLDSLISLMKPNDYVLLFSFDSVVYSNWDAQLIASLNSVGISSSTISTLVDGQAVIFLGKKGTAPGEAIEVISDGSITPITQQALTLSGMVTYQATSGSISTRRIGPAKSWTNFYYSVEDNTNDNFNIDLKGIDINGVEGQLFTGYRLAAPFDVSTIDAQVYPYLKLDITFTDIIDLTPPQIKGLVLEYVLPPEGILTASNYETQQLQEGQKFLSDYQFINISQESFQDSLQVSSSLFNINNSQPSDQLFNIGPPGIGDTTQFTITYETIGKLGPNNLNVSVTPAENELISVNNFYSLSPAAEITKDETNPVLNVTIDGNYILDGDIVSPNPTILITLEDDNVYLLNEDTTGIEVFLKKPCETCSFERVNFTDPSISFSPETADQEFEITYNPGPLDDGTYSLRVAAEDQSGNSSGDNDYEISFEVVTESAVTHFYPYPNPFSTNTKFVFTLTGSVIPDQIKIQIMTITGRVVKEINQDEIGPIKIGNNITEYAWDGRDEYGDLLANGVYLYRVFIRQQGESFNHRFTNADKSFKNGYGKIYILR
ncbi:MAG: C25 family cysteine peptidase [Bacteroidota bacterium]